MGSKLGLIGHVCLVADDTLQDQGQYLIAVHREHN